MKTKHFKSRKRLSKKRKRLFGGNEEVVYSVFDKKDITKEDDNYIIRCEKEGEYSHFMISENSIIIYQLSKCGEISGTSILAKIIKIGKDLRKNTIDLADASDIYIEDCKYSLSHYKILLTGQSWYNKFGFISENHDTDVAYNELQRMLPLHEFIITAIENYKLIEMHRLYSRLEGMQNPDASRYYKIQYDKIISSGSTLEDYKIQQETEIETESTQMFNIHHFLEVYSELGITGDMPVSVIIKIIDDYIRSLHVVVCDDKLRMLIQLIDISKYMLKYTHHLKLTLAL